MNLFRLSLKVLTLAIFTIIIFSANGQSKFPKRGLGYGSHSLEDIKTMSSSLSWWYNWYHQPDNTEVLNNYVSLGIEFAPMAWNGGYNATALRAYLQSHPDVKYLLGFNEPNFKSQANMTPSQAAAAWSGLEAIANEFGLKIVGPAMNFSDSGPTEIINGQLKEWKDPIEYLDAFFAACPNCKVDYIAAHCYMNSVDALKWYVGLFKKYNRPIWLTEFCAWEGEVSETTQKNYLRQALTYLDNDPDVFRYAWFTGRSTGNPYNGLLGASGQLTPLGKIYLGQDETIKNGVTLKVIDKTKGLVTSSAAYPEQSVYTWLGNTSNWTAISNSGSWWAGMYSGLSGGKLEKTADAWIWSFTFEAELNKTYNWNPGVFIDAARTENSLKAMHVNRNLAFSINDVGLLTGELTLTIENATTATVISETRPITTGLEKNTKQDSQLTVFPNPASKFITIQSQKIVDKVEFYNLNGMLAKTCRTSPININDLSNGLYMVKVIFFDGSQTSTKTQIQH